jgi:hypothetical protein
MLLDIVPAPGIGRYIVPIAISRVWSNPEGTPFSNAFLRFGYSDLTGSGYVALGVLPSSVANSEQYNALVTSQVPCVDSGNNPLSKEDMPIHAVCVPGTTGGVGSVTIDFFYIINDMP